MADPLTDAKIAAAWPKQWAGATRSKQRTRLRRHWRDHNRIAALRRENHSCVDCVAFHKRSDPGGAGYYCGKRSDFLGYEVATKDDLCPDWAQEKADD